MVAVKGKKLDLISCSECGFASKRITTVEKHILEAHGKTAKQLYDERHGGAHLCECGCGKETLWLNWKDGYSRMIRGHNASIYSVYDAETAAKIASTRGSNWRGKPSAWLGRTKDADEEVAARGRATSIGRKQAFDEGRITIWSKGKTKESDARVAAAAQSLRQGYADGTYVPWAKGQTKETDPRIAQMAARVALTHKTAALRHRLDEQKKLNEADIRSRVEEGGKLKIISDLSSYINDVTPNIQVECTTCGCQTFGSLRQLRYHRCYACDPAGSAAQAEIAAFIEKFVSTQKNVRNVIKGTHRGAELDIYVPSRSLAIEYNGLYWHSNIYKADNYHQNKSDKCKEVGITLVHIFQDEWFQKRHIVESIIKHRLGQTTTRVGARQCELVTVSPADKKLFFELNHIDGDAASMITLGLKHDGEIVMALSLRKPFHKKHSSSLEVARVCSKINTCVMGGLAKLSKCALAEAASRGYSGLISYIDTRHGSYGESWSKAGWTRIGETTPRWWWTDNHERFNRFRFRANKAAGLSEAQVAAAAGVTRIYGCKNIIFELRTQASGGDCTIGSSSPVSGSLASSSLGA